MIMLRCWWKDPEDRPTFSDLESDLNNFLTSVAGYLDFNEFALDVSPDLDPVPSHEEANGLSAVADNEQCIKEDGQEVTSAELEESLF